MSVIGRNKKTKEKEKKKRGSSAAGASSEEETVTVAKARKKQKRGGGKAQAAKAAAEAAATTPLSSLMSAHPSDVLDMPVDPNEPTYCLCHQVSYGEMIGCDNPDVSIWMEVVTRLAVTILCATLIHRGTPYPKNSKNKYFLTISYFLTEYKCMLHCPKCARLSTQ